MSKHLAVRFDEINKPVKISHVAMSDTGKLSLGWFNERTRYYIHPDSLPVLGPREGDLLQWGDAEFALATPRDVGQADPDRIIQRDGKPFFWPEREAV